jgi:hypothetical protein
MNYRLALASKINCYPVPKKRFESEFISVQEYGRRSPLMSSNKL